MPLGFWVFRVRVYYGRIIYFLEAEWFTNDKYQRRETELTGRWGNHRMNGGMCVDKKMHIDGTKAEVLYDCRLF
jgi:hypothetical protein